LLAAITARDGEVTSCLSKKDKAGALKASLQSPPVESKSEEVKVGSKTHEERKKEEEKE
jgi:hypothetical protein